MRYSSSIQPGLQRLALTAVVAMMALLSGCATLQDWRDENKGIQLSSLKAAQGYSVSLLASDLPKARHMVMGAKGTLFVGSMAGNVYALTLDGSTVKQKRIVLKGLTDPSGVAFKNGTLYVADRTRIVRFNGIEDNLDNPGAPVMVIDGLPTRRGTMRMRWALAPMANSTSPLARHVTPVRQSMTSMA